MKIIGHRGAKGLAPENTLVSFHKAIEHQVDEVEFDVRVTRDNIAIVHHNPYLSDPAGNKVVIAALTLAELRAHKPNLATLDETLTELKNKCVLLIEIKPAEPVEPIAAVLAAQIKSGWSRDNLAIGSFDQSILLEMHRLFPTIAIVVIERWSGVRAQLRARQLGTHRFNMRSWWLWSGFLRGMSRRGYQIAAYTLDDPAKARRWKKYGLYAVITDYPDRYEGKIW
ncbi:glycerophosphodiester phosphodiesterase [Candidatus Saccharibacteria bacterium]|nr:glycerophosphodiester phosphodiesterase [Candidatus Saccharibacteria bacterium]